MRTIEKSDLCQVEGGRPRLVTIQPAHLIYAAALTQALIRLIDRQWEAPDRLPGPLAACYPEGGAMQDAVGTSGDRWYAGAQLLALKVAPVLDAVVADLVDREVVELSGVLTYEYVEIVQNDYPQPEQNLAAWLFCVVSPDVWFALSENWEVPTDTALAAVVEEWALAALDAPTRSEFRP